MTQPTVFMAEMTWPEFGACLKDGPVIFLPTGMLEQHGPHLPMGVDHLLPTTVLSLHQLIMVISRCRVLVVVLTSPAARD